MPPRTYRALGREMDLNHRPLDYESSEHSELLHPAKVGPAGIEPAPGLGARFIKGASTQSLARGFAAPHYGALARRPGGRPEGPTYPIGRSPPYGSHPRLNEDRADRVCLPPAACKDSHFAFRRPRPASRGLACANLAILVLSEPPTTPARRRRNIRDDCPCAAPDQRRPLPVRSGPDPFTVDNDLSSNLARRVRC